MVLIPPTEMKDLGEEIECIALLSLLCVRENMRERERERERERVVTFSEEQRSKI
jgi:hypothetical protein